MSSWFTAPKESTTVARAIKGSAKLDGVVDEPLKSFEEEVEEVANRRTLFLAAVQDALDNSLTFSICEGDDLTIHPYLYVTWKHSGEHRWTSLDVTLHLEDQVPRVVCLAAYDLKKLDGARITPSPDGASYYKGAFFQLEFHDFRHHTSSFSGSTEAIVVQLRLSRLSSTTAERRNLTNDELVL